MILEKDIDFIRKKIQSSVRPLFFFDDDADGVSSFIQLYALTGEGKGIIVKGKPVLEEKYARKVQEYSPDLVIILDKPLVEREFFDNVKQEIIWLDHHPVQEVPKRVNYFNPRIEDDKDNSPTSYWAYKIAKGTGKECLWKAMFGIVGDWHLLLADECFATYPYLLPKNITRAEDALFSTQLGKLVKIVNWNLKSSTTEVNKSIKVLTRIEDPYDILDQKSSKGRFIYKKFEHLNTQYDELLSSVVVTDDPFLVFRYDDSKLAISSELSNELLFLHPDKLIIVGRNVSDEIRLSLRAKNYNVLEMLNEALKKTTGYGGGHDKACGASIKQSEFDDFLSSLREQFKNLKK
ncbi:DHH family phosphoesterase [Candidatus Woesearchaeota archaeon]|nr:DHH family phosphoesterase [Candidatus Woesearchaeota archaeon]MCF7901153.1 DHH family phosphoesterase [Candidatus Woesearchaeota archaeon]MCF8013670.1 DHH family phosphoesterase [Candidatus Woesearchaeota archaeon]